MTPDQPLSRQARRRLERKAPEERTSTLVVYECPSCATTSFLNAPDKTVQMGRPIPGAMRTRCCLTSNQLPVWAGRVNSQEFAELIMLLQEGPDAFVARARAVPRVDLATLPFDGGRLVAPDEFGARWN